MAEDLSKLKKKRTAVRSLLTKLINKIEPSLRITDEIETVDLFEAYLEQLKEKEITLNSLNDEIENLLSEDLITEDIEASEEVKEKIIFWKTKLSSTIKKINSPTSIQVDTVPQNIIQSESENIRDLHINLPKLHIDKFCGDYKKWLDFYNLYENSIHNNTKLSKVDKFTYLKSYLCGNALSCISGFAISEENYDKALDLLKDRFGNKNMLINAHLSDLLNLTPVKNPNDIFNLRNLYDKAETQIRSLESLGIKGESYSNLLTPILMKLIPTEFVLEFNRKHSENEYDLFLLLKFLHSEISTRERSFHMISHNKASHFDSSQEKIKNKNDRYRTLAPKKELSFSASIKKHQASEKCLFCNKSHRLESCISFNAREKRDILKRKGCCYVCLKRGHRFMDCIEKEKCKICEGLHHVSICFRQEQKEGSSPNLENENSVVSAVIKTKTKINNVLLQTCSVALDQNEPEIIRLFLDSGSMRSFVLKTISEKFNFPIVRKENLSICTFGGIESEMKEFNVVKIKLKNRNDPNLFIEIEALETDQISLTNLPPPEKNIDEKFRFLKNAQLADCYEFRNKEISILIGADYYYEIVTGRITRLNKNIVGVETIFGWCLAGRNTNCDEVFHAMSVMVNESCISKQLSEFWNLENLGIEAEVPEEEKIDEDIMSDFEAGISYQNNRYKVKFPWKPNMKTLLENNEAIAKKRFMKLRSSFKNDPSLFSEYSLILKNYLSENIIERVPVEEENLQKNSFYLPHRAVIRIDKTTSKVRIIFDASSHAKEELSLNDCLHKGLNFLPNLFQLLIKFRTNPIALVADIKMAFLMIEIDESERDFTRFFWDENPLIDFENKEFEIFRMRRVLFGVKSSPFLLAATIKHHLEKYKDKFPSTYEHLSRSLYVDDFLGGQEDVQQALRTCEESVQIFKEASMDLRKWRTNSAELSQELRNLGFEMEESEELQSSELISSKVLGVGWNEKTDSFYFHSKNLVTFLSKINYTKRYILQAAGRLFDPMGFVGPYCIRVKCLIQEIWCLGLDWDDRLPKQLEVAWDKWCEEIQHLKDINIPRYYFQNSLPRSAVNIQLHCFSDASQKGYGTVAYLRIELEDSNIISSFIASKSRVAPLKTLSIPRLELMGALLSARMSHKITTALPFPVRKFYWTDSSIAYYWIKGDPRRHKVFVKNRTQEIQKLSESDEWHHCIGKDNPADIISRGSSLSELKNNSLWWHGPKWLTMKETEWPLSLEPMVEKTTDEDKLELKKSVAVNTTVQEIQTENDLISRYSSFNRLIRISALCLRFSHNCRVKPELKKTESLTASDLKQATEKLVKSVQSSEFSTEIKCLKNGRPIPKSSKILSLNIFLDKGEILRVGGRLRHQTELSEFRKHQVLLPKAHHFTDLNCLSPSHLLTGTVMLCIPEPVTSDLSFHSRWKLVQSLRDRFWIGLPFDRGKAVNWTFRSAINKAEADEMKEILKELNPKEIVSNISSIWYNVFEIQNDVNVLWSNITGMQDSTTKMLRNVSVIRPRLQPIQIKCSEKECKNGGTCYIQNGIAVCICPERYDGGNCEIDKCSAKECKNDGSCYIKKGIAVCRCSERYEGGNCEIDKCSEIECKNDRSCYIENGIAVCRCRERYDGKNCEIDKCSEKECKNGGTCYIEKGIAVCSCRARYNGENCEIDKCSAKECKNDGSCYIKKGIAVCRCPERYEGGNCEIDKCSEKECKNHGSCYIENGIAVCSCRARYNGENCEIDICASKSCLNGGQCAVANGRPICLCTLDYNGDNCERIKTDADNCAQKQCQNGAHCDVQNGRAVCLCPAKYEGEHCEIDKCESHRCLNEGHCDVQYGRVVCLCPAKYEGTHCEIDKCANSPCKNGGNCDVVNGNIVCRCPAKFEGEHCEIDKCAGRICRNGGNCDVEGSRVVCRCPPMFFGKYCERVS